MADNLADTLAKVNNGVATATAVVSLVRGMIDMAKAAHPNAPEGTFPTDEQLIGELATKSGLLGEEVKDFRAWLKTQGPVTAEPSAPSQ